VAFCAMRSSRLRAVEALRWLIDGSILRVSARLVVRILALVVPFLGAGGLVAPRLTEFDINYYLRRNSRSGQRPPSPSAARVTSILIVRRLTGWVYALPWSC
jgi:hypothetical protein